MNTSIKLKAVADNSNDKEVKEIIKEKEAVSTGTAINDCTAQKLIEQLLEVKKLALSEAQLLIANHCDKMLEQLRLITFADSNKTTSKQRLNYMLNYSKKLLKGRRPIFAYFHPEKDGSQTFTDGYFLAQLRGNDRVDFNIHNDEIGNYPRTSGLIPSSFSDKQKVDVKYILNASKSYEYIAIKLESGNYCVLATDLLKKAFTFSNASGEVELKFNGMYKPVVFESNTGSTGVVLPIHHDGDINSDTILKVEKK